MYIIDKTGNLPWDQDERLYIMGRIENRDEQVACSVHPDQQVVWKCDECGKTMCRTCETIGFKGNTYCSDCIDKVETMPLEKSLHAAPVGKRIGARMIDTLILTFVGFVLFLLPGFIFNPVLVLVSSSILYIILFVYFVVFTWQIGQTPGKMAMEIEIMGLKRRDVNFIQALVRPALGLIMAGAYVIGMINFYMTLQSGMGVEHLGTIFEFFKEYHRYGISSGMQFFYTLLFIIMFGDAVCTLTNKKKRALHDFWARTRVVLS